MEAAEHNGRTASGVGPDFAYSSTKAVKPTDSGDTMNQTGSQPDGDAAARDFQDPVSIDQVLEGGYRIVQRIGAGGMGVVYRGWDERLRRPVAVKIMRRDRFEHEGWRDQFVEEARLMAGIRHANVVEVFYLGQVEELPFFVMEFVEGRDLRTWLRQRPHEPPISESMEVIRGLCRGAQAVHEAGVLHRDLKPENVLVRPDGRVAITDFGLSHRMEAREERWGDAIAGTPAYLAPEVITDSAAAILAARIDVYALGVMAYELLTGHLPFDTSDAPMWMLQAQVYETPEPPSTRSKSLTDAFDPVFERVFSKDPVGRFDSPREFLSALERAHTEAVRRRRRPRVLVVDDEDSHLEYVEAMLRSRMPHLEIIGATSGERALEVCRQSSPDLVIIDLFMPGVDGQRFLERLRKEPSVEASRVVVMTGHGGSDEWKRLYALGCDDILLKPFNGAKLASVVERFIEAPAPLAQV